MIKIIWLLKIDLCNSKTIEIYKDYYFILEALDVMVMVKAVQGN